jgi:hypothetical protein
VTRPRIDLTDPMFKPLTIAQVLEITERSRRTVNRWIQSGRLTAYEEAHRRQVVFNEDEVVELEHETTQAAHQGRPRPKRDDGCESEGVDAGH